MAFAVIIVSQCFPVLLNLVENTFFDNAIDIIYQLCCILMVYFIIINCCRFSGLKNTHLLVHNFICLNQAQYTSSLYSSFHKAVIKVSSSFSSRNWFSSKLIHIVGIIQFLKDVGIKSSFLDICFWVIHSSQNALLGIHFVFSTQVTLTLQISLSIPSYNAYISLKRDSSIFNKSSDYMRPTNQDSLLFL